MHRSLSFRIAGRALPGAVVTLVLGTAMAAACRGEQALARQGDLIITGAYAHPSAGDAGAAYVRFRNGGSAPDTLIGMSGPEPATAMLMGTTGGRMEMLPPLVIKQGEQVGMQPGGTHVMLGGLRAEYKIGDTLRLTLTFARAGQIRIAAPVVPFGEIPE